MSDRKIPFCKVYETEGGRKVIGFPGEIRDEGDLVEPALFSYPILEDIDVDGRAEFLNKRAERWAELNGGSDE